MTKLLDVGHNFKAGNQQTLIESSNRAFMSELQVRRMKVRGGSPRKSGSAGVRQYLEREKLPPVVFVRFPWLSEQRDDPGRGQGVDFRAWGGPGVWWVVSGLRGEKAPRWLGCQDWPAPIC